MTLRHGILTLAAIGLGSCKPLNGTDPLDSGTVSAGGVVLAPHISDGDEAEQMQSDRLKKLATDGRDGSSGDGYGGMSRWSEY